MIQLLMFLGQGISCPVFSTYCFLNILTCFHLSFYIDGPNYCYTVIDKQRLR